MIDPKTWTLPNPERVIAAMRSQQAPDSDTRGCTWSLSADISPLDFYCYLKLRFGEPNGFAMTLKSPDVNNLIHWEYTLECPETIIDILGLNFSTELRFYDRDCSTEVGTLLESKLLSEIEANRIGIKKVRNQLERWHLFINPYARLSRIIDDHVTRLRSLKLADVSLPATVFPRNEQSKHAAAFNECLAVYREAASMTVTIQTLAPVWGEAAVNVLILLLARREVRDDSRMYDAFLRQNIDVRIKGLHLHCHSIDTRITGSEEPFKQFMRLMNRRNAALHGNVDPKQRTGSEIFFDQGVIPLTSRRQTLSDVAMSHALASVDPEAAFDDVAAVTDFVALLLSNLNSEVRETALAFMNQEQLGYRPSDGHIGLILPDSFVDVKGSDQDAGG